MAVKLIDTLLAGKHLQQAIRHLRALEHKLPSRESRFAVPFVFRGKGLFKRIEPRQNPFEIESLYREVCSLAPGTILEIGTARGGTLYLWTQAAQDNALLVSVDLPGGEFGGAYDERRAELYMSFPKDEQKLHLLRLDSHKRSTFEKVKDIFGEKTLDFLFIDGDHKYLGAKMDFETYGPLVREGGLIAFHDILPRPDLPEIEVSRLWQEIRSAHETEEFIGTEESGRKIGIGIIRVRASLSGNSAS